MFRVTIEQENRNVILHCNDCILEDKFIVCEDVSFIKYRPKSNTKEEIIVELSNKTFSNFNVKDIIAYHVEDMAKE